MKGHKIDGRKNNLPLVLNICFPLRSWVPVLEYDLSRTVRIGGNPRISSRSRKHGDFGWLTIAEYNKGRGHDSIRNSYCYCLYMLRVSIGNRVSGRPYKYNSHCPKIRIGYSHSDDWPGVRKWSNRKKIYVYMLYIFMINPYYCSCRTPAAASFELRSSLFRHCCRTNTPRQ